MVILICAFSSSDKGKYWPSRSTVVIRLRKCHFQSFQQLSGTSLKNLSLPVVLPGGSSSELRAMTLLLGGSSSTSNLTRVSTATFSFLLALSRLSATDSVFTL